MAKTRVAKIKEEVPAEEKAQSVEAAVAKKEVKASTLRHANLYVHSSYNNVLVSLTDESGNVLSWASSGSVGFKGPRKATPFAASKVIESVFTKLGKTTIEDATIFIRGIGSGRDSALRAIVGRGVNIVAIRDITPIPHNGCKAPKVRRV